MSAHQHSWRPEAADGIFAQMEFNERKRCQLQAALESATSRRQRRRLKREIGAVNRADDDCEAEYAALMETEDGDWAAVF